MPSPDLSNPVHLLAFGFGSGCAPKAPGTFGTLVGVLLYLPLSLLPGWGYLLATVLVTAVGPYLCGRTSADLGVHDHGGIVWDEIAGMLWVGLVLPPGWGWLLAGFLLFRLFDITKPWPIGWLDRRVGGGLGIMLDDLAAAAFAMAVILCARWLV